MLFTSITATSPPGNQHLCDSTVSLPSQKKKITEHCARQNRKKFESEEVKGGQTDEQRAQRAKAPTWMTASCESVMEKKKPLRKTGNKPTKTSKCQQHHPGTSARHRREGKALPYILEDAPALGSLPERGAVQPEWHVERSAATRKGLQQLELCPEF